jgi:hypothetical protein
MAAKFPRVISGHPTPIEEEVKNGSNLVERTASLKLCGLPVSQGEVRGKARVVTSLDEASNTAW